MLFRSFDDFSGASITSVQWDPGGANESLTLLANQTLPGLAVYYKIAPTVATSNVRVTLNAASSVIDVGAILLTSITQASPFGPVVQNAISGTTLSKNVSQVSGGINIGIIINSDTGVTVSAPFTAFLPIYKTDTFFGLKHASVNATNSETVMLQ